MNGIVPGDSVFRKTLINIWLKSYKRLISRNLTFKTELTHMQALFLFMINKKNMYVCIRNNENYLKAKSSLI